MSTDVVRSGDRDARSFFHWYSGTISAGTKTGALEFCGPSAQVGMIRRSQTATLFDIEKNDRLVRKAFTLCDRGPVARVGSSLLRRCSFVLEFATQRAAIKKQKAKTLRA